MNLRNLTDSALVEKTELLANDERNLLTTILHHLREIEARRLFSAYGYKSLFEMAVRHFGYTEDAAYRRIAAMRLMAALPEVEEKIKSGEINVTHLSMAQTHFRQEKKLRNEEVPLEEQAALIEELSGQTVREAEKTVLAHSSAPKESKPDRVKVVTPELLLLQMLASVELLEKIETLKGWLAHQHPGMSHGDLFGKLCDLGLQEWDPRKIGAPLKRRAKTPPADAEKMAASSYKGAEPVSSTGRVEDLSRDRDTISTLNQEPEVEFGTKNEKAKSPQQKTVAPRKPCVDDASETKIVKNARPYIRAEVRRFVFQRAKNRCEICESTQAPQIDHIIPVAFGGTSEPENLRLLCRRCNQRAAIEKMGRDKMETFLH